MATIEAMDTVGARIAAVRAERGWSQGDLAAALVAASGRETLDRTEVSRWEHGRRQPTPYWLALIAGVLQVPTDALRPAGPAALDPGDALAAGLAWLLEEPPQLRERRAGRRVGDRLAKQVTDRIAQLRHLDDTLPAHELAPVALREYAATEALVNEGSYTAAVGRSLLASLGEAGQILGWVESDAHRHAAAQAHYLAGFEAARAGGDTAGAANLLSCLSYQWVNAGNASRGRLLASAAVRGAKGRVTPLVDVLLHERLAYAHAHAGDRQASERALGEVDELFAGHDPNRGNEPEWTYWLSREEIDVMAARCATRLGRPAVAAPLIRRALAGYSTEHVRELALYWSFLAESHLRGGERPEAADALATAAHYASGTDSARVGQRVAELRRALATAA